MSERKICFHLGAHKTGSTWIQRTLRANETNLRANGCSYLGGGSLNKEVVIPLLWAGRVFRSSKALRPEEASASLQQYLDEQSDGRSGIVFSSETALGPGSLNRNKGSLYSRSNDIVKILSNVAGSKSIVYLVRNYADYIESIYIQTVKEGSSTSFDDYMRGWTLDDISWQPLISRLQSRFEDVSIIRYEDFQKDQFRVLRLICDKAGYRGELDAAPDEIVNQSYSGRALAIARHLNPVLRPDEVKAFRRFLLQTFPQTADNGRPRLLPDGLRDELTAKYLAENF